MLPLKLILSTSSHQKISEDSRPLFLPWSVISNTIFQTNLQDLVYENFGRLYSTVVMLKQGLNILDLHVFSQLKLVARCIYSVSGF